MPPVRLSRTARAQQWEPVVGVHTRGKSKEPNWRRPDKVAVIALELDLSGDPRMLWRIEKHWDAAFQLRRALQRDAGNLCRAWLAAKTERETVGPEAVRGRLSLTQQGIEARARNHAERAGWMRCHLTKAAGLHIADEVWHSCDRFLFPDKS